MKLLDNLTEAEAKRVVIAIRREEAKLRALGGNGNYSNVEYRPWLEAGTVFGGQEKPRYAVHATRIDGLEPK